MSDAFDWVERFIHLYGSPNLCYATEICNWHKDVAHSFTFGTSQPQPDYAETDLTILWGHNPAKTWLARASALAQARKQGTRLVVVDPRRSNAAADADRWLRIRPGTDGALALGLANLILERGDYDTAFVRSWTNGPLLVRVDTGRFLLAEELDPDEQGFVIWDERAGVAACYDTTGAASEPDRFALEGTFTVETRSGAVICRPSFDYYRAAVAAWPIARTMEVTGISELDIVGLAEDLTKARSVSYATWTGVGQHTDATQTERAIATLYALTGSYDAPGGNYVLPPPPVNVIAVPLAAEQAQKALGLDEFPLGPPVSGWITARSLCRSIIDGEPYRVRALVSFGGNMLLSQPDPNRTAEALSRLEFSVHIDLFENPTARFADYLLPANTPWEREGLRAGFEITQAAQQRIQLRPQMLAPLGESRSDLEIVFDLATRLGMGGEFFHGDIESAWNHQLRPLGLTVEDLRARPGGIDIDVRTPYRKHALANADGGVRGFATPTRRVEFYSERLLVNGYPPVPQIGIQAHDDDFPLTLTCAKNGYYCHSQQRHVSSLRKRSPEPTAELGETVAASRGIADGDLVEIVTRNAVIRMRARVDPNVHPDAVVAEYGWWQSAPDLALPGSDPLATGPGGQNYNLLVDDSTHDPISGSVPMRSTKCEIRRVSAERWIGPREFIVESFEQTTADIRTLVLRPSDDGRLPGFRPGQHITLAEIGKPQTTRAYSLTGPAHVGDGSYSVAVRRVDQGVFSPVVHQNFTTGARVLVTAPSGMFAIPVDHSQPVVLLASGVGITPFLGYLETLATTGGNVPKVVLLYGNRNSSEHAFADRLRQLESAIPQLKVINYYSRPAASDKTGDGSTMTGRMTADSIEEALIQARARFYMCGSEAMIESMIDGLVRRGVPRFDIFAEKFHATPRVVSVPADATATIKFAKTGTELKWAREDGTLLDFAEKQGKTLPAGCRVGQCESCAITVLEGEVAHLVAPADDLPPDQALLCQAMPLTDIVIDA